MGRNHPSFAILGSGAMGCRLGAHLYEAGYEVALYDGWREHVECIRRDGLTVRTAEGERRLPIPAFDEPQGGWVADYAVVLCKLYDTEPTLRRFGGAIGPRTTVVTLQNGIGAMELLPRFVSERRIVFGVTTYSADLPEPGCVELGGSGATHLASVKGGAPREAVRVLAKLWTRAGFVTTVSSEALEMIWEKLAFNAAMNPVCAVAKLSAGDAWRHPACRELAETIVAEIARVAACEGVAFDGERVLARIDAACREGASARHLPSMLQDVLKRKRTEIDAMNGAVARLAERHGFDAAANRTMVRLIRMIEDSYGASVREAP